MLSRSLISEYSSALRSCTLFTALSSPGCTVAPKSQARASGSQPQRRFLAIFVLGVNSYRELRVAAAARSDGASVVPFPPWRQCASALAAPLPRLPFSSLPCQLQPIALYAVPNIPLQPTHPTHFQIASIPSGGCTGTGVNEICRDERDRTIPLFLFCL